MDLRPAKTRPARVERRSLRERLTQPLVLAIALVLGATLMIPMAAAAGSVRVPASIDATGSRNVSAKLQRLIRNAPNGSTIVFKKGGTYKLRKAIRVANKRRLTIVGNGATLKLSGGGDYWGGGIYIDQGSRGITVRDLSIIGNHRAAGTRKACCRREGQHGIGVHGSSNTLIERVHVRRVGGDCFNLGTWYNRRAKANNVTIRGSTCELSGRMGVTINGGKRVRIVGNRFDDIGYAVFGMEPNAGYQGSRNIVIRRNKIGRYSLTGNYRGALLYSCDAPWSKAPSTVRNVKVINNTVEGNRDGKSGRMVGLNITVCGDRGNRRGFVIKNNIAKRPVTGPVMRFTRVKGITVRGNTQPLRSGPLARIRNSSNVTYRP